MNQSFTILAISIFVLSLASMQVEGTGTDVFNPYGRVDYADSTYQYAGIIGIEDIHEDSERLAVSDAISVAMNSKSLGGSAENNTGYLLTSVFGSSTSWRTENIWAPPEGDEYNWTVTELQIYMVTTSTHWWPILNGTFSFTLEYDNTSAIEYDDPREDFYWYNSSLYHYPAIEATSENQTTITTWDITSLHEWNMTTLYSDSFAVMWVFNNTDSNIQHFDYLGISYEYLYTGEGYDIPVVDDISGMWAILWLVFLFGPVAIIAQYAPVMGYAASMIIMLIIIVLVESSFLPVAVVGFISVSILLYKGAG